MAHGTGVGEGVASPGSGSLTSLHGRCPPGWGWEGGFPREVCRVKPSPLPCLGAFLPSCWNRCDPLALVGVTVPPSGTRAALS